MIQLQYDTITAINYHVRGHTNMEKERQHQLSHNLQVRDELIPFYEDGRKTIEVRTAGSRFERINPGDIVIFNAVPQLTYSIEDIRRYPTFEELLAHEKPEAILPGLTIDHVRALLHHLYRPRDEARGVLAFELKHHKNPSDE